MLYFKLYPFTLLKQSHSFTLLFMHLGELLQYYLSSNTLNQSARKLDFDPKTCYVLLDPYSHFARGKLFPSHSFFVALICLGPRVALLVVDLSPSQSFMLTMCCSNTSSYSSYNLMTCLHLSPSCSVLFNISSRCARC